MNYPYIKPLSAYRLYLGWQAGIALDYDAISSQRVLNLLNQSPIIIPIANKDERQVILSVIQYMTERDQTCESEELAYDVATIPSITGANLSIRLNDSYWLFISTLEREIEVAEGNGQEELAKRYQCLQRKIESKVKES